MSLDNLDKKFSVNVWKRRKRVRCLFEDNARLRVNLGYCWSLWRKTINEFVKARDAQAASHKCTGTNARCETG